MLSGNLIQCVFHSTRGVAADHQGHALASGDGRMMQNGLGDWADHSHTIHCANGFSRGSFERGLLLLRCLGVCLHPGAPRLLGVQRRPHLQRVRHWTQVLEPEGSSNSKRGMDPDASAFSEFGPRVQGADR